MNVKNRNEELKFFLVLYVLINMVTDNSFFHEYVIKYIKHCL
jgi:hypothetical protein